MEHENDKNEELTALGEQMKALAMRAAVLAARGALDDVRPFVDFQPDLRTYLLSGLAQGAPPDVPNVPEILGKIMGEFEPVIARMELEAAGESADFLADLPVYKAPGEEAA